MRWMFARSIHKTHKTHGGGTELYIYLMTIRRLDSFELNGEKMQTELCGNLALSFYISDFLIIETVDWCYWRLRLIFFLFLFLLLQSIYILKSISCSLCSFLVYARLYTDLLYSQWWRTSINLKRNQYDVTWETQWRRRRKRDKVESNGWLTLAGSNWRLAGEMSLFLLHEVVDRASISKKEMRNTNLKMCLLEPRVSMPAYDTQIVQCPDSTRQRCRV